MRIARSFSTSLRRTKQSLYEPYVAPLNQEQKKALRKVIAKGMPSYHGALNKDVGWFLEAYGVRPATQDKRQTTLRRVTQIIQSAFGSEYSVIDRSLYLYARDFDHAPLELTIVDETKPQGRPQGTEGEPLPDAYNHEALAELLQKHGYTGSFIAGDAMRNLPPADEDDSAVPDMINDRGPLPITSPWPSYTPYPTVHLTYPPVLFTEHISDATLLPFFLSPPVPTHEHLIRLLRTYTSAFESLPQFITLIILWTRSINLPELTPTCIALMVIGWLQHRKTLPSFQNPSDPKDLRALASKNEGVWFRGEQPIAGQDERVATATWLETGFLGMGHAKPSKKLGPLLHDFFNFWSVKGDGTGFISSVHYLSIRDGAILRREKAVSKRTRTVLNEDDRRIAQGRAPTSVNEQPIMWQTQPIVVQDPFVPSFNHAQSMSKSACNHFHQFCSLSTRTLSRGHPLTTILGKSLPSPSGRVHRNLGYDRSYSTTPSSASTLKTIFEANYPPPEAVVNARRGTISHVKKTIRKRFGDHYDVECFGSTRYGVGSATSDLDLVIIDRERIDGFGPDVDLRRLPDVYNVRLVARALFQNGFVDVFAIPGATVPIVKFRDPRTGLDCDVNTNDQLGLWNTRLIAQYCDLAPDLLRPMIMAVKCWAKSHGLNDPSGRSGPVTFSSYALVLMVIGYLQMKGALPNLQAGLEPLPIDAKEGVFWMRTKKGGHVRCDARFKGEVAWRPEVQLDVNEALAGWFTFWANEHQYAERLLSIREGGLVKRVKKDKVKKKKKTKKGAVTTQEGHEDGRAEEEDAIIAAFSNQSDSEEGDDAEEEHGEEMQMIDIAAEGEGSLDWTDQSLREAAVKVKSDGVLTEDNKVDVPPAAEVGILPEDAGAELEVAPGPQSTERPSKWNSHILVVADPFILAKNVCGNIGPRNIERFQEECRRAVSLLHWGVDLEGLMGDGEPLAGVKPVRGWGVRGGRGGRGGRGTRGLDSTPGRGGRHQGGDQERGQEAGDNGRASGRWQRRGGARGLDSMSRRTQDGDRERGQEGGDSGRGGARGQRRGGAASRGGRAGRGAPEGPWRRAPPGQPQTATATLP